MSQGKTIVPQIGIPASRTATPVQRAFASRAFLVAVIVMAVVGVGMQFMTNFMQVYFKKEPVPLRGELISIPDQIGPWTKVSLDEPLPKDVEDALAAKEYIFRDYVDVRVVGKEKLDELMKMPIDERRREMSQVERRYPRGVVHFAVTYYTGLVDTVAHIPDRCYIADGYEPTQYNVEGWKLGDGRGIEVRYINFEDTTGFASKQPKNVAYFFQVNGVMESDPLAVRRRLQNLFNRQGYYAKVEVMSLVREREEAAGTMKDFLTVAMPEVQKRLPALPGEVVGGPQTRPSQPEIGQADNAAGVVANGEAGR